MEAVRKAVPKRRKGHKSSTGFLILSTIVAFCVTMIGYVSTQPQPGDASSPQLFWMTMFVWLGLPVIGWICNYIAMAFYPLSREKMVEVQEKNAAFRAEQKVQSESAAK